MGFVSMMEKKEGEKIKLSYVDTVYVTLLPLNTEKCNFLTHKYSDLSNKPFSKVPVFSV